MSAKDTGGPAFPVPLTDQQGEAWPKSKGNPDGMTLRDYFAAKAGENEIFAALLNNESPANIEHRCAARYRVADAMLKERAK